VEPSNLYQHSSAYLILHVSFLFNGYEAHQRRGVFPRRLCAADCWTPAYSVFFAVKSCSFVIPGLQCGSKEENMATLNSVVRARIDEHIKHEAEAVLASIGLTASDAFRMLMMRIAKEKALPFEPLVPNNETIEAMKAARRGELVTVGSADNLLGKLNARD